MRLSKEEFCNAVNTYQKMLEKVEEVERVLKIDPENVFTDLADNYYNLLLSACEEKQRNALDDWLAYYCFGMNFGKKYEEGDIVIDGKNVPLRNVEDLWHILELDGIAPTCEERK